MAAAAEAAAAVPQAAGVVAGEAEVQRSATHLLSLRRTLECSVLLAKGRHLSLCSTG